MRKSWLGREGLKMGVEKLAERFERGNEEKVDVGRFWERGDNQVLGKRRQGCC